MFFVEYMQEKNIRCLLLIAASLCGVRASFLDVFSIIKFYTVGVTKVAVGTTATVFTMKKKRKKRVDVVGSTHPKYNNYRFPSWVCMWQHRSADEVRVVIVEKTYACLFDVTEVYMYISFSSYVLMCNIYVGTFYFECYSKWLV